MDDKDDGSEMKTKIKIIDRNTKQTVKIIDIKTKDWEKLLKQSEVIKK